jgi:hypothetical protein
MADEENIPPEEEIPTEPASLEDVVGEAEQLSEEIARDARTVEEEAQQSADLAKSTRTVISHIEDPTEFGAWYEEMYEGWSDHRDNLRRFRLAMGELPWGLMSASTSGTAVLSSDSSASIRSFIIEAPKNFVAPEGLTIALDDYDEVISRSANRDKVIGLMKQFDLDKPHKEGEVSPMDQFQAAYDALNRPVSGEIPRANTALIPMREAIDSSLDSLLHRTSGARLDKADGPNKPYRKVMAIAKALSLDEIDEPQFRNWAQIWHDLLDELSGAKKEMIGREELRRLVNKSTLFLSSLLGGLDSDKLN